MTDTPNTPLLVSPLIEKLRDAVTEAGFEALGPAATALYEAAQNVIAEYDSQMSYVHQMLLVPRPTAAQIHEQLMADQSPNIVNTGVHYANQPLMGVVIQPVGRAKGTLDP